MPENYLEKLKKLSSALQARLSDEKILARLDELDAAYGIKSVLILLGMLSAEIDYVDLSERLKTDYGFNDFLADKIKEEFGRLIKDLGEGLTPEPEQKVPAREVVPITFSRADEEEIMKYSSASPSARADYSATARDVISRFGYQAGDEVMRKRLENIIIARIRDVRDDLETGESLARSKKVGGLDFSEADADRLIKLIKGQPVVEVPPAKESQASPPAEKNIPLMRAEPITSIHPTIEMEDGLPIVKMPQQLQSAARVMMPMAASALPEAEDDVKIKSPNTAERDAGNASKEILPLPLPQPFIADKHIPQSVLNAKTAARPNLDDVKLDHKLKGPIEELEAMTIIDFRRLAADPQAAVNKIKDKVDLLEQDGLNRKISGIEAWQKNEVSRFYRLLGQLSMSENKEIEAVIRERLMSGKPTLSLDEFHAVMELNRALRY